MAGRRRSTLDLRREAGAPGVERTGTRGGDARGAPDRERGAEDSLARIAVRLVKREIDGRPGAVILAERVDALGIVEKGVVVRQCARIEHIDPVGPAPTGQLLVLPCNWVGADQALRGTVLANDGRSGEKPEHHRIR